MNPEGTIVIKRMVESPIPVQCQPKLLPELTNKGNIETTTTEEENGIYLFIYFLVYSNLCLLQCEDENKRKDKRKRIQTWSREP